MKILITGAGGLAGSHLVRYIRENRLGEVVPLERHDCDLMDRHAVEAILDKTRPDIIFHLAAQSSIPVSWKDPAGTMNNNVLPGLHIFEAVRKLSLKSRILVAGSSEEYGLVPPSALPIVEDQPLRPVNPYATSKMALDFLGYQHFRGFDLSIVRARSFNHIGPSVKKTDVANDWVRLLVRIERGLIPPVLPVGNLETGRDFLDVRDVVRAYWLIATEGIAGEVYNIASGKVVFLKELLHQLLEFIPVKITVAFDPAKQRPGDSSTFMGDSSKLRRLTGWEPKIPLTQSLKEVLDFWRKVEVEKA
ncbi:MAG: GDP-mannose 4,6-dehydratase [Deltaproteobacteria bacterium]|nr:GDP-mannose 4,6-dehydratase [Deltaproteobacteria bacterium]